MIESRLKELLKEKGIKQQEIAELTGIRLATISFYCTNKWAYISKEHLNKLCKVLNCEVKDLLVYKDDE